MVRGVRPRSQQDVVKGVEGIRFEISTQRCVHGYKFDALDEVYPDEGAAFTRRLLQFSSVTTLHCGCILEMRRAGFARMGLRFR